MRTCPEDWDNPPKGELIPDALYDRMVGEERILLREGLAAYQLVGEVTAHQGYDG